MSAPSIPNLLSLRGRGTGRRGRGGGRLGGSSTRDSAIQGTDSDAAISRLSAVELGYMQDPFARYFAGSTGSVRRLPIINRGTYTRTMALDRLIYAFLQSNPTGERQIISLGAGTDTRCLRLFSSPETSRDLVYHELDFPTTTAQKLAKVQNFPALRQVLPDAVPVSETNSWKSKPVLGGEYFCHGVDLREISDTNIYGLRVDVPTLLLSECCLCYLDPGAAQRVISYFTERISHGIGIALYEAIRPDDAFGRMMVTNLAARQIRMPTLEAFKEPASQEERLRAAGFEEVKAVAMDRLWSNWVPEEEMMRVDGLEGLDEVEEWNLLAGHYVVAWGSRGEGFAGWQTSDFSL
ncbi:hypothetical protein TD95_002844 [Thielaviopsis punctulata]|uniref:Leucine carboxyl methyltransferase 1 n=1 Tax=Thielaviopsis punctulata TaxID=72032 RepID=A0A0F4ZF74_9PEZI|nr:hypothetical protein TD95_002844 [Thielaviopsis punctulata]